MRLPFTLEDDEPRPGFPAPRPASRMVADVRQRARSVQTEAPFRPVEHFCACGAWGCYGLGPPAAPVLRWFCPACVPDGVLPARAVAA